MAAEERYLEEQRKNWAYYHFHSSQWSMRLEKLDEEQKRAGAEALLQKWGAWYDGLTSVYTSIYTSVLNEQNDPCQLSSPPWGDDGRVKQAFLEYHWLTDERDEARERHEVQRVLDVLSQKTRVLEKKDREEWEAWLLNGWFPQLRNQRLSSEEQESCGLMVLRLLLGGLFRLTKQYDEEIGTSQTDYRVKVLCLFAALLDFPGWHWQDLFYRVEGAKDILQKIFAKDIEHRSDKPPIRSSMVLREEGKGTAEERFFIQLQDAIENEKIMTVDRMRAQIVGRRHPFRGWIYEWMALAYAIGPEWLAICVAQGENPFIVESICDHPLFAHDLRLLQALAERAGVWGRMEVAHHLLGLLKNRHLRLSFRLLIYHHLYKVTEKLFELDRTDIVLWLFDQWLPWRNTDDHVNIGWLGKIVGQALAKSANSTLVRELFRVWEPVNIKDQRLERILIAVREALSTREELLAEWNKGIVRLWLSQVLKKEGMKGSNLHEPFTFLENAVIPVLIERYAKKKNLLMVMRGLCHRWDRIETEWFSSKQQEAQRRNRIMAAILVGVFVLVNLEEADLGEKLGVETVLCMVGWIVKDERFWTNRSGSFPPEKPGYVREIERAILLSQQE